MSNPSWVSVPQLTALADLLPVWPDRPGQVAGR
jgi:hypothetical protein